MSNTYRFPFHILFRAHRIFVVVLLVVMLGLLVQAPVATAAPVRFAGVNLAGADFGEGSLPGTFGVHYTYPTSAEVDYFMGKGMNVFRLPFRWERLQRSQNAAFDTTEQGRMDTFVNYATGKGASVVLDPHNYARYFGSIIGSGVPVSAFTDFWTKLANHYKSNSRVIFGLINEPHTMSTELWRDDAQAAINAIRATGATNLILVPGNAWTGAHSWFQNWYGTPNATVMISITDPGNNFAFEFHQYFDADFSGTQGSCVSGTVGSEKMAPVTTWLRQNGKRGFLGEFGGWQNSTCYAAIDNILDHIDANADVWLGWTYWAAGPWWPANDQMTIEPANGQDKPQMAQLIPHLSGGPVPTNTPINVTATRTNTRTNTPISTTPTRTNTRTNTPIGPTPTRTRTRTNTPVGPTATRTNTPVGPTPTRSNTPIPPTNPPGGSLKLQYRAADTVTGDNQIKPHFNIVNTGTTSVNMSELKIRYYFTKDAGGNMVFWCDWAVKGCGNLSGAFAAATGTNTDTYLEVSFTAGAGSIAAGQTSGEMQFRLSKSDWTNFNESNDYSFDATKTAFADWNRVVLLRNGTVVWGTTP